MEPRNSALLLVLLLGVLCSCASAYYFPNGPPIRPSRRADDGLPHPEPKQLVPFSPKNNNGSDILTFDIPPVNTPDYKMDGDDGKPEPRPFIGIQMVPQRKNSNAQRQSSSCRQSYSFAEAGQSATLQSPNYPRDYPNNVDTSICFTSPSGTTMKVSCDVFNVEYAQSCLYDYFGIGFGGDPSSVQKYCGRGTVSSPASSGNSLAIVFKSDGSNPGTFRSAYRFRCRVTVSESSETTTQAQQNSTTTQAPPSQEGDCECGARNDGNRIVGGEDAKPNEFPWRCYLKTSQFFCGCSIISNKWILTAAHCTAAVKGSTIYVVVGDHIRSSSTDAASRQIRVDKIVQHAAYNDRTMDNDVSLLRLSETLTFGNTISPVCLPFKFPADEEFSGTTVTASGWGTTSQGGSVSDTLKEVDLPVLTTSQCSTYYPGQITDNMICTYEPGKDTCQGDSGGSIDLLNNGRYYGIGVVSWGIGCAREDNPGVYAKTTKYLDWIKTNSEGESFCQV